MQPEAPVVSPFLCYMTTLYDTNLHSAMACPKTFMVVSVCHLMYELHVAVQHLAEIEQRAACVVIQTILTQPLSYRQS